MKFIGLKETAETTKQLKGQAGGPHVEIMYSVNSENETVEVFGTWHITDSKFVAWEKAWKKAGWKYAGTTRRP